MFHVYCPHGGLSPHVCGICLSMAMQTTNSYAQNNYANIQLEQARRERERQEEEEAKRKKELEYRRVQEEEKRIAREKEEQSRRQQAEEEAKRKKELEYRRVQEAEKRIAREREEQNRRQQAEIQAVVQEKKLAQVQYPVLEEKKETKILPQSKEVEAKYLAREAELKIEREKQRQEREAELKMEREKQRQEREAERVKEQERRMALIKEQEKQVALVEEEKRLKKLEMERQKNEKAAKFLEEENMKKLKVENEVQAMIDKSIVGIEAYQKLPRTFLGGHLGFFSAFFDNDRGKCRANAYHKLLSNANHDLRKKCLILFALLDDDNGGKELKRQVRMAMTSDNKEAFTLIRAYLGIEWIFQLKDKEIQMMDKVVKMANNKPTEDKYSYVLRY